MIIVFVMDAYGMLSNGTSATARRFASELRRKGHTVRILTTMTDELKDEPDLYGVEKYHFPVFQFLMDKQGFCVGKSDLLTMYRAIKGADVVHLFLPFPFEAKARLVAELLGVPVTCAFHLQPQNITYTLYLGRSFLVNDFLYREFYRRFYRYVRHVHCPSSFIAAEMQRHGYRNNVTHVISNGVSSFFHPMKAAKPEFCRGKYVILMIGRLSREKRQDLLIRAIGRSSRNKDIVLILAGQGPTEKKLRRLARRYLANAPLIGFQSQESLRTIINYSDLYVHCSDVEAEAIACIEAFSCGLVPVISDSPLSATNQFALTGESLFRHGSYRSLTARIEYFMNHPERKSELSREYLEYAKRFELDKQVIKIESMFRQAIAEQRNNRSLLQEHLPLHERRRISKTRRKLERAISRSENEDTEKRA